LRTAAGLRPKKCGAGAGWDGLRGGRGLEVCGAGADKISIPAGAGWERTTFLFLRVRGGFKFCGCGPGADKKFQPAQDSSRHRGTAASPIFTLYFVQVHFIVLL